jgi:hypothetical protein
VPKARDFMGASVINRNLRGGDRESLINDRKF